MTTSANKNKWMNADSHTLLSTSSFFDLWIELRTFHDKSSPFRSTAKQKAGEIEWKIVLKCKSISCGLRASSGWFNKLSGAQRAVTIASFAIIRNKKEILFTDVYRGFAQPLWLAVELSQWMRSLFMRFLHFIYRICRRCCHGQIKWREWIKKSLLADTNMSASGHLSLSVSARLGWLARSHIFRH